MTEKSSKDQDFVLPVRVYIEDTDAGGIVYYVNYLKFMERARTEYLRSLGYQHYGLSEENYQFVVHSCQVRYHSPARIDDALGVSAGLRHLGKATLLFAQQVRRGDQLLCEAEIKIACVSADGIRPKALPAPLYQRFKAEYRGERAND
ncbi:tol-pal system-associated acyl-CoA thioesterase [Alloalcanivorax xenomutans]|uniref:Tol-pal system-associated acyl-CoA thioesterase n=1 Tax=Alloalcanivorax xenomutans TaxID=1094342 RepID=A0A9Q3W9R4_9GAMM|nr:tol-pal system-associated acyl-CoA thioesterase [Alloalcanivorax xenomutans]MCE7510672.1 tol-pal system-associated acyl-CoA thioesterase [Alloalcanivorax xenomutans]SOC00740.1 4-hydroxybenzoyl-CoA thioesterase [Alloalcanivorax xenomutans]|tara:strand:- start:746 stop:1189 length:444 start_codon:yes stop_codon:yes gene_type:complete